MIRAPGYREVTERVSDSDHLQMAWRECLYSAWSELSVMGLFRRLQLSLSLDNSLSAVSQHPAISDNVRYYLSPRLHTRTHVHTNTQTTVLSLFPMCHNAISLHIQNLWHSQCRDLNYRWCNFKLRSLTFKSLSCATLDENVKKNSFFFFFWGGG